ncbi:hypothetical protein HMPREF9318_01924 [Streptococcus urinalis FB127-CNA-2]|uniref:Membrane protein n=1 Tax=Streptococcus urinalis 2285-97 TaxID=764291 RepID=G5KDB1_9STRE|nr:PTS sugar transporter subunit IIC [Streptococcus urinalis]EHJ56957.1 putative membrane protein [Streptococcus urinalis 2285-97]EKS17475.1 hypothetical protein HMPREF9318_01924 [Streptococcus urinalis FB127-CNA-2]VEF32703.1 PTS cellobiose-specific IIC component [Streptococcus urinalis]
MKSKINHVKIAIYKSMRRFFPLALIYSFVTIVNTLFLTPHSFFSETIGLKLYQNTYVNYVSSRLINFNNLVLGLIIGLFAAYLLKELLEEKVEKPFLSSLFQFLTVWFILGSSNLIIDNRFVAQPFWVLLILLAFLFAFASHIVRKWEYQFPMLVWIPIIVLTYVATSFNTWANKFPNIDPNFSWQGLFFKLAGSGPVHLYSVLLWSIIAIIIFSTGFPNPSFLIWPDSSLPSVSDNLNTILKSSTAKIPHLFNLYTVHSPFALFGGVGLLLALACAMVIYLQQNPNPLSKRLLALSFIPLLFDQSLPFVMCFPLIFQPILVIPMILSTLIAELIGASVLYLGWLTPAIYNVPNGTPNLLFGFLASNGDWRYLLIVLVIMIISTSIYYPFVKKIVKGEDDVQKVAQ